MWRKAGTFQEGIIPPDFNFGKDLVARSHVVDNWDHYALNSMRAFRENSLRYRAKPYFKYLMKIFRNQIEYPLFDRYWKMVSSVEQDKEANTDFFSFHHSEFGEIKYTSSSTVSITSFGELYLVQYLPLDARTSQLFEDLTQASWPRRNAVFALAYQNISTIHLKRLRELS